MFPFFNRSEILAVAAAASLLATNVAFAEESLSWVAQLESAQKSMLAGRPAEAQAAAIKAAASAEEQFGFASLQVAQCLHTIGEASIATGNRRGGFELLQKAAEIQATALPADHPVVIETLLAMSQFHLLEGRLQMADLITTECIASLELRESKFAPPGAEVHLNTVLSKAYMKKGQVATELGQMTTAKQSFSKALARMVTLYGEHHPATLGCKNALGVVAMRTDDFAEAENLFSEVLEGMLATRPEEHPNVAIAQANLAGVYSKQGLFDKAEDLFAKSLKTTELNFGEESLPVGERLERVATFYEEKGDLRQAETTYIRGLTIRRKHLPADDYRIGFAESSLGLLYLKMQRFDDSRTHLETALKMLESSFGTNSGALKETLDGLFTACNKMGDEPGAEQYRQRASRLTLR